MSSYTIRPVDFMMNRLATPADGNRYQILPLPKLVAPPSTTPVTPATTTTPVATDLTALLDQQVFGIPVKYIALGVAAWFLMRK